MRYYAQDFILYNIPSWIFTVTSRTSALVKTSGTKYASPGGGVKRKERRMRCLGVSFTRVRSAQKADLSGYRKPSSLIG